MYRNKRAVNDQFRIDCDPSFTYEVANLDPLDPPVNLEILNVTDNEVLIKWNKPSLESGNPGDLVIYRIEYLKYDLKSNNMQSIDDIYSGRTVNDGTASKVSELNLKQVEGTSWIPMNTTSEKVALYNLNPNSLYLVRVRAFNGASYSEPSPEISFKTLSPRLV
ncbi:hypothetical protein RF11_02247 [Thelohanellus kitauei]|uniref:Fibronectin type-III domain-containing protein n=1 Tax=Thelohanellus kitauei TaxID=669202 RepID=A0A0C2IDP5_THEKT|nr:hypothetical protein RF11_02247 [Thelohanellus kitauei]